MPQLSPTVTGSVSSYSVTPGLPAGLSLEATTGMISGTPTAITAAASYTITASNSVGSTTANVSITVNDVAPTISYGNASYTFTSGVAVTVTPVNTGGTVVGWSIDRALPEGLTFNTTDGSISGVPTTAMGATTYVVNAQNSGGTDTAEINIAVDSGVLLDLGHGSALGFVRYQGDRIVSQDALGHWSLWNSQSGARVAEGDGPVGTPSVGSFTQIVDFAGDTIVVRTSDGLQLRAASSGQVIGTVTAPLRWWMLATDGSYVAAGNKMGVSAWTRTGTLLFSLSGNYDTGYFHAAPNELRIAHGPAGPGIVETITVATGASSSSVQYVGQFRSWFADGQRFLTVDGTTVRIFGADGGQQDERTLASVEGLGGLGEWFWSRNSRNLNIYQVGASVTPAATYDIGFSSSSLVIASATSIGVLNQNVASRIDLSGTSPVKVDHAAPVYELNVFAATTDSRWIVGNKQGVLVDISAAPSAPRYFTLGVAWDIAASPARIAVATASGSIVYFDAATRQQQGTIEFPAYKLALSENGNVLAAGAFSKDAYRRGHDDRSLKVFSLPDETEIRSWPATDTSPQWPYDFSLAKSGQVIGRVLYTPGTDAFSREVVELNGGALIWSDVVTTPAMSDPGDNLGDMSIRLSPSGSRIAVANYAGTITSMFENGTAVASVQGWPSGWNDENTLVAARFAYHASWVGQDWALFNGSGQQLRRLEFVAKEFRPVDANRVYDYGKNRILSLEPFGVTWTRPANTESTSYTRGDVTATHVIFFTGSTVRAEPY